ncbi:TonB-dependent receptor [Escherichia coli]|nr:TonB-dependent receptor [Escherichia coli]
MAGSSKPLALTTGVRMDDHETYGEHWSPRAQYRLQRHRHRDRERRLGDGILKHLLCCNLALTGRAISCRGACKIVGSPDLKPETSESWELGLYYMGEEGWLEMAESSVTVFRNDVKDRDQHSAVRLTSTLHRATKILLVLRRALTDGAYRYLATTTLTKLSYSGAWKPN